MTEHILHSTEPHVATKQLNCGWSEIRCLGNVKYTLNFKNVFKKRTKISQTFYID